MYKKRKNRISSIGFVLLLALFPSIALAQQREENRFALVIGNSNYAELGKLKNPQNDATDMAATLRGLGFEVDLLVDGDLVAMEDSVLRLGSKLSSFPNSIGLFFYAGHGVQSNGINYLVPADARIPGEAYLKTKALAAQSVLDTIQNAKNKLNLVILDACRDNPYGWARSGTRGLTIVGTQPPGSIVVYATSAGSVAQDGSGRNGIFTGELLKNLNTPGLEIGEVFKRTGFAVQGVTNGLQNPAVYSQYFGSAYLNEGIQGILSSAQVASTGTLGIKAPDDVRISIRGSAYTNSISGSATLKNLPLGTYRLEATGRDYLEASATLEVRNETETIWEPYTTGTLFFDVEPAGASILLMGKAEAKAEGKLEGISPGSYRAVLRKPGYRDTEVALSVTAGKASTVKASMTVLKPGSISTERFGTEVNMIIDGEIKSGEPGSDGRVHFKDIPSGRPVSIKPLVAVGDSAISGTTISLAEGEDVKFTVPAGRFILPWVAPNSRVSINGNYLSSEERARFLSPLLPQGRYYVSVSGKYEYNGYVDIPNAGEIEIPGYREMILEALSAEQQGIQKSIAGKKGKTTLGFVSLGTGLIGAASTLTVYYLGSQAATAYSNATNTVSAQAARSQIQLYGNLFPVAAALGGLGLGLSPILLFSGPDTATLLHSIDSLNEQINALRP